MLPTDPEQAIPGARTAEGPSPAGGGGMEPAGFGPNHAWVWSEDGLYVADVALWRRAWLAETFKPELEPD